MRRNRIVSALALLALLALPACSSPGTDSWEPATVAPTAAPQATAAPEATASAGETASFTPSATAPAAAATIEIRNGNPTMSYDETARRLNEALWEEGLNVEFRMELEDTSGGLDYFQQLRQALAAGEVSAQAYALAQADSQELFRQGLTRDMTELVRQFAPGYFTRYRSLFGDRLTGVPVGVYQRPVWFKPTLNLRNDALADGGDVRTLEDFYAFARRRVMNLERNDVFIAPPYVMLEQWAAEQGYYSMSKYGPLGYVYLAVHDQSCTPVLLENIPGFTAFLKELMELYRDRILCRYEAPTGTETIGFVNLLGEYEFLSIDSWMTWLDGQYTAQPFTPELPSPLSIPRYAYELAVPAKTGDGPAGEVARFVEWCNASQENYDMVVYGTPGVDFEPADGRFTPLLRGQKKALIVSRDIDSLFFSWPGAAYMTNMDYHRLPTAAPANIRELMDNAVRHDNPFPLDNYLDLTTEALEAFKASLGAAAETIGTQRMMAIMEILYLPEDTYRPELVDDGLVKLAGLNNKAILEAYKEAIKKLMDEKMSR